MTQETVTLTIDGKPVTVPKGTTVFQAARQFGTEIPHYCYHDGLSIAGNCRMCMVKIEKMPKPVISCSTIATEGMVVDTQSDEIKKVRKGVLEFILINHPLDCPICDQAGECGLQDYYMKVSGLHSRMEEQKNHKQKVKRVGPRVVLDQERCILCARCTRFTEEVSQSYELGIFSRGDRSYVDTVANKTLNNPYSENVVDICPVGALTSEKFRFKKRVWYLKSQNSVCPGCSRGCNIKIDINQNKPYRIKARPNLAVNKYWMCDQGRDWHENLQINRIESFSLKGHSAVGEVTDFEKFKAHFNTNVDVASLKSGEHIFLLSLHQTQEELQQIKDMVSTLGLKANYALKSDVSYTQISEKDKDQILITGDAYPNRAGLNQLFANLPKASDVLKHLPSKGATVWVFGPGIEKDISPQAVAELREKNAIKNLIVISAFRTPVEEMADLVLPSTPLTEKKGTYINVDQIANSFQPVVKPFKVAQTESVLLSWFEHKFKEV